MSTPATTARRSPIADWLPVLVWAPVIFAFSSMPSLHPEHGTWEILQRKLAHVGEYAVLGALLLRASRRAGVAVLLAVAYAVSDEAHQVFVEGRNGTPRDVAIDALGAFLGVLVWQRLAGRHARA